MQTSRKDLLSLDFEGIMKHFRVHLPKKFTTDEDCVNLFQTIDSMKVRGKVVVTYQVLVYLCEFFQVTERKLKKYDKEYQAYRDSLAQEEDPINRLEVCLLHCNVLLSQLFCRGRTKDCKKIY